MVGVAMTVQAAGTGIRAERRVAALLVCELRGFARLSEELEPAHALQLESEFLSLIAAALKAEQGEIVTIANDVLLAAFRGGDAPQVAAQAVRAAQRIQSESAPLAEAWRQKHGLRVAAAMALHLGETLFGAAGPAGREQFIALGDPATVVQRLLLRARAGEFVLSHAVIQVVSPEGLDLDAEPLPPLELGRREPIRLYGVLLSERLDFTS